MKLSTIVTTLFFAVTTVTAANKKYIIRFPADTPQSEVDKAAQMLKDNGAQITHEFPLIKGFSVESSEETMESFLISAQGLAHQPFIEDDHIVMAWDSVRRPTEEENTVLIQNPAEDPAEDEKEILFYV